MSQPSKDIAGAPSTSPEHNLSHRIALWARDDATRPAWSDDTVRRTYGEAEAEIERLAGWLADRHVERGDRVALWLGNRALTLELLFATIRLGAIAIPLNARLTPHEIGYQLADSRARLVIVEPEWEAEAMAASRAATAAARPHTPTLQVADAAFADRIATQTPITTCCAVIPDEPALMMYTSGTTGAPKGALLPHRKALYNARNAELFFDIRRDDRVLVVAPLFHSLGLQILALPAVHAGASLRLQNGFDPVRVWETIRDEAIRYFGGVPTMFVRLADALDVGTPFDAPPESLRFAFTAGAAAPPELIQRYATFGLPLLQGYGQTETSTLTCTRPADVLAKAGSVGHPVEHGEVRLIRPDSIESPVRQWRDAGIGEVGEVVVRGAITMLGYWERPEETAATLREGWLRTGDLATRDADFDLTLVGRARELFISGGENVYPAEIEAVLESHPDVAEAAVLGVPDPQWGEVGRAHVVRKPDVALDEAALRDWLEPRLARFKQPRDFRFETSLPRTASGKIQKHRLRSRNNGGDG